MIVTDYNDLTLNELIAISESGKAYVIEDGRITKVENEE